MSSKQSVQTDSLSLHLRDIGKHSLLTPEQEQEIGMRALNGDEEAQHHLVRANMRFVVDVAKRYRNSGLELNDLISAGNEGLIKAARKFDPRKKVRFVSYAYYWISQQITKELDATNTTVHETGTQMVRVRRVRRLLREAKKEGKTLTMQDIIDETGYTEARVRDALDYNVAMMSLDAPVDDSNTGSVNLGAVIGEDDDYEERTEAAERQEAVDRVLESVLDEREIKVVRLFFGIGGFQRWPLADIGASLGISRERARQLKERALVKIRKSEYVGPLLDVFMPQEVPEFAKGALKKMTDE